MTSSTNQSLHGDQNSFCTYHGPGQIPLAFLRANALEIVFARAVVRLVSAKNDAFVHADGLIVHADGLIVHSDGLIVQADGLIVQADGLIVQADGLIVQADGLIVQADGLIVQADGLIVHSDGLIVHADGLIVHVDGLIVHADGLIVHADGLIVGSINVFLRVEWFGHTKHTKCSCISYVSLQKGHDSRSFPVLLLRRNVAVAVLGRTLQVSSLSRFFSERFFLLFFSFFFFFFLK